MYVCTRNNVIDVVWYLHFRECWLLPVGSTDRNSIVQSATMTMFLRQTWRDPRLSFRSTSGRTRIRTFAWNRIWLPDTFVRNEISSRTHDVTVANRLLRIESSGDIWYVVK